MNPHSSKDRRSHPRRSSFLIATYTVSEGTFRDIVRNLSAGGLSIRTERPIAVGQSIRLRFPLTDFDRPVEVTGTVTRTEPGGFAVTFDEPLAPLADGSLSLDQIVHELDRKNEL